MSTMTAMTTLTREEVKKKILELVPTNCPACNTELHLSDCLQHLTCPNPECSGKFFRRLENMVKAFGIENIGLKVAEEMVNTLNLTALHELYDLSPEDILKVGRFREGMANKIYNSIQSRREVTWEQFLRGIQIKRIGEGTARELSKKITSLDEFLNITPEKLANTLERATTELTSQMVEDIQNNKEAILELAKRVTISYGEPQTAPTGDKDLSNLTKDLSNLTVVVTGSLEFGSRSAFAKKYNELYGIKFGSSVTSNTNILIANQRSTSSKFKKAEQLNVRIMTEREFVEYVETLTTS